MNDLAKVVHYFIAIVGKWWSGDRDREDGSKIMVYCG